MITLKRPNHELIDYVWLIYLNIIYSFVFVIDNMQMMSTIALLGCTIIMCFCVEKGYFTLYLPTWKEYSFWYILFFLFASVSYVWSFDAGKASSNIFTTLAQTAVFLICVDCYVISEVRLNKLIQFFFIATFLFAVIVLVTSPVSTYNSLDFGGITKQHRNTIGYVLMFGAFFDVFLFFRSKRKIYCFAAAVCFLVSLLSGSRKIIIGYALAVGLWVLFQNDIKKILKYIILAIIAAFIFIPIAYQIPYIRETFGERLLAIFDDSIVDGSILARNRAKELAKALFVQSPIIGNGWNAVVANYAKYWDRVSSIYAHNNYLELAADFGIIGLFLFYFPYAKELSWNLKRVRTDKESKFIVVCLMVVLVLDYGQVTYWYMYEIIIFAILFKWSSQIRKKAEIE